MSVDYFSVSFLLLILFILDLTGEAALLLAVRERYKSLYL